MEGDAVRTRAAPGKPTEGRGYSDAEIDWIAKLLGQGFSAAAIAAKLSSSRRRTVSRGAIIGIVHRNRTLKAIGFARSARTRARDSAKTGPAPRRAIASARLFIQHEGDVAAVRTVKDMVDGRNVPPVAGMPQPNGLSLAAMENGQCRFPLGRARPEDGGAQLFCAAPVSPWLPGVPNGCYCAGHRAFLAGQTAARGEEPFDLSGKPARIA